MARKSVTYTESSKGRDHGKQFLITELGAEQAEEWGAEAVVACMNAGVEIPDNFADQGLAGIARVGFQALTKVPFSVMKPLWDSMMQCVQFIPDPARPNVIRPLFPDDIEEVKTRLKIRKEIFMLHVNFSTDESE